VVAVLLRLRFRVLANTLSRNPMQLVAVIVGAVFSLFLLAGAFGILALVSQAPASATQIAVVAGGAVLTLGWLIVPLLFDGVDRTLDPSRLARFPLRVRQIMLANFVVGLAWVPGVVTTIAALGTAVAWIAHPVSVVLALLAGLVGVATCVVGSRLTTLVAGSLLRGRGAARIAVAALGILVLAGPAFAVTLDAGRPAARQVLTGLGSVVEALGWTPLGAIWSVPGRVALGDFTGAIAATALGLGTLAVLTVLWRVAIGVELRSRGEGPARGAAAGRLGPLGWLPSTPTGAVTARSLIYWFRDARLARQLILIPVLPLLMLLAWKVLHLDVIAYAIGPLTASLLPLSVFAGLSYDGTAYAAELAAGVRGVHDRLGRAIALLAIAGPAAMVVQVVIAIVIGHVGELPAMLGLTLGILLVSVGVVSVSSARIVVPIARSGRNVFSAQPGSSTVWIVGSYAVTGITLGVALPVAALAIAGLITGAALIGWIALAVGLVWGGAAAVGGILLGGRVLDASGPAVLARLRRIRD
jgi:ABC-2 type transport system permease protein